MQFPIALSANFLIFRPVSPRILLSQRTPWNSLGGNALVYALWPMRGEEESFEYYDPVNRRLARRALLGNFPAAAQTLVDLRSQSQFVDFQNAPSTRPLKTGTLLPSTCNQGEMYFLTTAAPGANVYGCSAANTWTVQSAGGAGSTTIENTGSVVGYGRS